MRRLPDICLTTGALVLATAWVYTTWPLFLDGEWVIATTMTGGFAWAADHLRKVADEIAHGRRGDLQEGKPARPRRRSSSRE